MIVCYATFNFFDVEPFSPAMGHFDLRSRILAWPKWVAVAATAAVSVLLSIIATVACMLLLAGPHSDWVVALSIAACVPLLVSVPVSNLCFSMLYELEAARAEAIRLSNTDLLTGVLNRRRFVEVSEREITRASVDGTPTALLLDESTVIPQLGAEIFELLLRFKSIPLCPSRQMQVGLDCPPPATARADTVITVGVFKNALRNKVCTGCETTACTYCVEPE